jgi:hypothetical protein
VEFEPGFIDVYQGEDKLYHVLAFMDKLPFWMSEIQVHGTQRIKRTTVNRYINKKEHRFIQNLLKESPGWAEIAFINTLKEDALFSEREYLLGWIIASLYFQHGFALELALKANEKYDDSIFMELKNISINQIRKKHKILAHHNIERIGKNIAKLLRSLMNRELNQI